jgi:uncharacterized protein (TIGR00730 family)
MVLSRTYRCRVGLLCGAEGNVPQPYLDFATELGTRLDAAGIGLVHGGVPAGLLGAAIGAGSNVISVVPHWMLGGAAAPARSCEVQVVRTVSGGQRLVQRLADCFVVLPGGLDTLDQLSTLVARGPAKPVIVANLRGYFDPLLAQLDRALAETFITAAERDLIEAVDTVDGLLRRLAMIGQPAAVPRLA